MKQCEFNDCDRDVPQFDKVKEDEIAVCIPCARNRVAYGEKITTDT